MLERWFRLSTQFHWIGWPHTPNPLSPSALAYQRKSSFPWADLAPWLWPGEEQTPVTGGQIWKDGMPLKPLRLEAKLAQFLTINPPFRSVVPSEPRWVWMKCETLPRNTPAKGTEGKHSSLNLTRKPPNCLGTILNMISPPARLLVTSSSPNTESCWLFDLTRFCQSRLSSATVLLNLGYTLDSLRKLLSHPVLRPRLQRSWSSCSGMGPWHR